MNSLVVVANERAVRASAFDPTFDGQQVIALDTWLDEQSAVLTQARVASKMEELALAASVIAARGGNPSMALARDLRARLRRAYEEGLDPLARGGREGKRGRGEATPSDDLRELALALQQKGLRSRSASALLLTRVLEGEPLLAAALVWPARVLLRDIVQLTPALCALFHRLARLPHLQLEVELPLIERPLGLDRARDALEQLGDRYAELLDGPPLFRSIASDALAECTVYPEPSRGQALIRAMASLGEALDGGVPSDACALAWPNAVDDDMLRALAQAAARARIPLPQGLREPSARGVDELLRWCELLAGDVRFDELLALLRSPLLELSVFESVGAAREAQRQAAGRLAESPLPRGPAVRVLADVAEHDPVFATLASLANTLGQARTFGESLHAVRHANDVLGLARGASRGGTMVFRQDEWPLAADRALLAALAFEERSFASFERTCEDWAQVLLETKVAGVARGVRDVATDLRQLLESTPPRLANLAASVGFGSFGALASEGARHVVVADASFDRWASPRDESVSVERARLDDLAKEAEFLLLCGQAARVHLIVSGVDERGGPPRLHPMFESLARATVGEAPRLVLSRAEAALLLDPAASRDERALRQAARENWRGDGDEQPDAVAGWIEAGLPTLATAAQPLSPHAAEQFVACPYRGFVGQALRARAETDAEAVADPSEEGRLLHDLLERAFVAAKDELDRPDPDPARVHELGMRAADAHAAPLLVGIRRVQLKRLLTWVARALDEAARDREWRFEAAELAFGNGQAWPALCIDDTWYSGRLDRLDRARASSALRVVDYKRSSVGSTKQRLQLPIYAAAAEVNDSRHGHAEHGVYLVPRRAGGASGVTRVPFEQSATEMVRASIVPVLERLRKGDVAPRPAAPNECQRCDVRGVCRRPPFRVQEGPP